MDMHKYCVDKLESDRWELENIQTGNTQIFDLLKDVVNHLKKDESKFSVLDYYDEGIAYFENGKVYHVSNIYGDDDYMKEHYQGIVSKSYEGADCRSCGDGGCVHCMPSLFI